MTVFELFVCDNRECVNTKSEKIRSSEVAMGQSLPKGWICWVYAEPDLHFCSTACLDSTVKRLGGK